MISDTHGLLRPEAIAFLKGAQYIIHGGDIGDERIVEQLARLAPLLAVRGNNDSGDWAAELPLSARLQVDEVLIHAVHDIAQLDIDPIAEGVTVVIAGHSHKPKVEARDGILYVNPGSAGPRRFKLPIACAELLIRGTSVQARVVEFGTSIPVPAR